MSDLKIEIDSKVLFGNRYPNIFIDKADIYSFSTGHALGLVRDSGDVFMQQALGHGGTTEAAEEYRETIADSIDDGSYDGILMANKYSCYIPFDKNLTVLEIVRILEENLVNLNLYTLLNPYYGFNRLLEQGRLNIYDVLKANHAPRYIASFETSGVPLTIKEAARARMSAAAIASLELGDVGSLAPQIRIRKLGDIIADNKLSDAEVAEPGRSPTFLETFGFIIEEYRDKNGDSIVRIPFEDSYISHSQIIQQSPITSIMAFSSYSAAPIPAYGVTPTSEDTFYYHDAMGLPFAYNYYSFGELDSPVDRVQWRNMYNSLVGDVTYEKIFEFGAAASPHEDVFVYAQTLEAYPDKPIQALNGNYYAVSDGTSQQKLVEILNALIAQYEEFRSLDDKLENNISRLELVLGAAGDQIGLLYQLNTYRIRYPDKSSIEIAGKFYGEVKKILGNFNTAVRREKRVKKVLALNPVVEDRRSTMPEYPYAPVDLSITIDQAAFNPTTPGGFEGRYDLEDPHIPDYSDHTLIEGNYIPSAWHHMSRVTKITTPWGGTTSDYMEYLVAEGVGGYEEVEWTEGLHLFGRTTDFWGNRDSWTKGDTVVQNKGYWFFDYEKALHATSVISKVFNVARLEKYLGYKIPYEYFPIKSAELVRREKTFTVNNFAPFEADEEPTYERPSINMWMDLDVPIPVTARIKVLPVADQPELCMPVVYSVNADVGTSPLGEAYSETISDTLGHAAAAVQTVEAEGAMATAGTFFAVAADAAGEAYSQVVSDPFSAASLEQADHMSLKFINFDFPTAVESERLSNYNGMRVRDGYRLACFEYVDFMDDDIAFYNTIGDLDGGLEVEGSSWKSRYYTAVAVTDKTSKVYKVIYGLCKNAYTAFMKYHQMAEQDGSSNIYTDKFTVLFKEGTKGHYPTPESQPWTRAAFVYEAMKQILYDVHQENPANTESVQEAIKQNATLWEQRMGPATGTLAGVYQFRYEFLVLLNALYPQVELPQVSADLGSQTISSFVELGFAQSGTLYGSNPVYEQMMMSAFPALVGSETDTARPDEHGLLFNMLDLQEGKLMYRGQRVIEEPIYGNLLTSAMNASDFVSTVETPVGVSVLENDYMKRIQFIHIGPHLQFRALKFQVGLFDGAALPFTVERAATGETEVLSPSAEQMIAILEHRASAAVAGGATSYAAARDDFPETVCYPGAIIVDASTAREFPAWDDSAATMNHLQTAGLVIDMEVMATTADTMTTPMFYILGFISPSQSEYFGIADTIYFCQTMSFATLQELWATGFIGEQYRAHFAVNHSIPWASAGATVSWDSAAGNVAPCNQVAMWLSSQPATHAMYITRVGSTAPYLIIGPTALERTQSDTSRYGYDT